MTKKKKIGAILLIYEQKDVNRQTSEGLFRSRNQLELHILMFINFKNMLSKKVQNNTYSMTIYKALKHAKIILYVIYGYIYIYIHTHTHIYIHTHI